MSMPGSAYHKVALKVAEWLSVVPQCKINSSSKSISDTVKTVELIDEEEVVSFDVSSLYTNVPLMEAIEICTEHLYSGDHERPPVDRDTFITFAKIASCDVLMSTHDGYYQQVDGLAMGSPPAPHLANGWLSQFDDTIKGDAVLYARYMDDIIQNIKKVQIEQKLTAINGLHPSLRFTIEREENGSIPFLDMRIIHSNGPLSSTWYNKPIDTGLIMNYHALAPKRYKRSVVSGFAYRIYRASSSWQHFHESLQKAKQVLEHNQYPPNFYDPIIKDTLNNISQEPECQQTEDPSTQTTNSIRKFPLVIQYRGKCTEEYARALHHCSAPCSIIITLRKLKTTMPSLKPTVEKMIRSGVVYQISCPRCTACYVGQTSRHLQTRFEFREHTKNQGPVKTHLHQCNTTITEEHIHIKRGEPLTDFRSAVYTRARSKD